MGILILYISIVVVGYFVGMIFRKKNMEKIKWIGPLQTAIVTVLLTLMGIRLGANEDVVRGLGTIGIEGFVSALFAIAGSLIAVVVARNIMGINKKGERND